MTSIFRKRSGLGFLDEPPRQSSLGDQKGKETVFVKAGASTSAKPEIKENIQKNKTFHKECSCAIIVVNVAILSHSVMS